VAGCLVWGGRIGATVGVNPTHSSRPIQPYLAGIEPRSANRVTVTFMIRNNVSTNAFAVRLLPDRWQAGNNPQHYVPTAVVFGTNREDVSVGPNLGKKLHLLPVVWSKHSSKVMCSTKDRTSSVASSNVRLSAIRTSQFPSKQFIVGY
jgi:hypothetical protein